MATTTDRDRDPVSGLSRDAVRAMCREVEAIIGSDGTDAIWVITEGAMMGDPHATAADIAEIALEARREYQAEQAHERTQR